MMLREDWSRSKPIGDLSFCRRSMTETTLIACGENSSSNKKLSNPHFLVLPKWSTPTVIEGLLSQTQEAPKNDIDWEIHVKELVERNV